MAALSSPRSRLPLVLWVATALFILYGTTIPFNFVFERAFALAHFDRMTLNPLVSPDTGRRVSTTDFISNVLLFVPFGCFGIWSRARSRWWFVRILWVALLGMVLSGCVETLQLFTVNRTSSVSDVFANTLGAGFGAVAATVFRAGGRKFLAASNVGDSRGAAFVFPLLIALAVLLAAVWEPFDVTLDVGSVVPKLRTFMHDPWQGGPLTDEALSWTQHLFFTSLLLMWLKATGHRRPAMTAGLVGMVAAVGLEASQLFIASRMPGVWDASIAVAGSLCGVLVGEIFPRIRRPVLWCLGLFVATAAGAAMQQLSPFTLSGQQSPFQWFPFLNYYERTTSLTVSHSAELLLAYFPLGFGFAIAIGRRPLRTMGVLVLALAIAAPVEYAQRYVGGRFADVTDIVLSVAGAWLGLWVATEGWRRFDSERGRIISTPQ